MKYWFVFIFLFEFLRNGFSQEICYCDSIYSYISSHKKQKIKSLVIRNCDSLNFDISDLWIEELSLGGEFSFVPQNFIFPKQVKELSLFGGGLIEFPSTLCNLDSLRILWLNNCRLNQVNSKSVSTLKNLKKLILNNNFFDTIDDNFFNNTAEYIDLNNCSIKYVKLQKVNNYCKVLNMRGNYIQYFVGLNKLVSLKKIDIGNNSLKLFPFKDLKQHKFVENVALYGNDLTEFSIEFLKFSNLRFLDLDNNQIKNIPRFVSNLKYLWAFSINNNKIAVFPKHLFKFNLKLLDVKDNPIKYIEGKDELLKIKRETVITTDDKNECFRQFVKNHNICCYYYNERNSLISSCPEKEKNARELFIFFEKSNYK